MGNFPIVISIYKRRSYFVPGIGECIGTLPFARAMQKADEQAEIYATMKNFIILLEIEAFFKGRLK